MTDNGVDTDPERLQRIDSFLAHHAAEGRLPGVVFLLRRNNETLYCGVHGVRDPENGAPMTRDTVFELKSMTKFATALVVLTALEEGRLSLMDAVSDYIPSFTDMRVLGPEDDPDRTMPATRPILIRDLLLHCSGLSYGQCSVASAAAYQEAGLYFDIGFNTDLNLAELVDRLAALPLAFQPGTRWAYSWSFDVLGRVLEIIDNKPLDQVYTDRLFCPLGLSNIGFVPDDKQHGRMAAPPQLSQRTTDKNVNRPRFLSGGEGLIGTADDWAQLVELVLNGGRFGKRQILARRTVNFMLSDQLGPLAELPDFSLEPAFSCGLGVFLRRHAGQASAPGNIGEFGWWGSWGTAFWGDPIDGVTGILMMHRVDEARYYCETLRFLAAQALSD